jgi:hypothetical protein
MSSRRRVIGLVHDIVFVTVCLFLLSASDCGSPSNNTPEDYRGAFGLGYCAQDGLNAFPYDDGGDGGGTGYVKRKFSSSDKEVALKVGPQDQELTAVIVPQGLYDYWYYHCIRDGSDRVMCLSQLFAVMSLVNQSGGPIDTLGGTVAGYTWPGSALDVDWGSRSAFIPVVDIEGLFEGLTDIDCRRGISKSTIHELGHLLLNLTDCRDYPVRHDYGNCAMADVGLEQIGGQWVLRNHCADQWRVFSDNFCAACVSDIRAAKVGMEP